MGVYYFFYNKTKFYKQNEKLLTRFCEFITKFNSYPKKEMKTIFKQVIELNKWDDTDVIIAVPDYYDEPCIIYKNNTITITNDEVEKMPFFDFQCNNDSLFIDVTCTIKNESKKETFTKKVEYNNSNHKWFINIDNEVILNNKQFIDTFIHKGIHPCIILDIHKTIELFEDNEYPLEFTIKFIK